MGGGKSSEGETDRKGKTEILRKTEETRQTAGKNFCERTVPGNGVGGCRAWGRSGRGGCCGLKSL